MRYAQWLLLVIFILSVFFVSEPAEAQLLSSPTLAVEVTGRCNEERFIAVGVKVESGIARATHNLHR